MAEGDIQQPPVGGQQSSQPVPGETIAPGQVVQNQNPETVYQPSAYPEQQFEVNDQFAEMPSPQQVMTTPAGSGESITWMASEFVSHQKSAGWYGALILATAIIAVLIWFLTKDMITTVVIVVCAIFFGVYAGRRPRQLRYELNEDGFMVGEKFFSYSDFRSFAVIPEGINSSITFIPLRRFMPLTPIYYAPQDEPRILAILSARLPVEERQRDPLDRFMTRIRF